ncbi:hypothetical protein Tco_0465033 [Tanacetum coccineum]
MERITIKEYEIESEVFDLLKIDLDLFTCDTPLGTIFDEFRRLSSMDDDLFAYELGVLENFLPCFEQPYDNLKNGDIDIYEPRQCYDEYARMFVEVVILIDNRLVKPIYITLEQWLDLKFVDHKKVNKEIIEVNGINTNVECDPTNIDFAKWLASKFNNHTIMDWYTKNALWLYWKRGDDEGILTYDEFSDLEEENLNPPRFKTYEDYKNVLINEWNNEVPWVEEKPWLEDGNWKEPTNDICNMNYFQNYEWYEGLKDGNFKDEALKEKAILEGSWGQENREGKNF